MMTRIKAITCAGLLAGLLASACGDDPTSPSVTSLSVGAWSGTTSQGAPITFTVSANEVLTTLSVGYSFNGCSATETFSNLNVSTVPDIQCVPGPCSGTIATYRALSFTSSSVRTGPITIVNGVFVPGNRAQGVVSFFDFPGCGTATGIEWSATRR
jgi:hypothetical protein